MTRANIGWLLLFVLLGMLGAAGYTMTRPVLYSASSTGYVVVSAGDTFSAAAIAEQKASSYVSFIGGQGVLARVREEMQSLPGTLSAQVVGGTPTIVVTAVSSDRAQVAALANAGVRAMAGEIDKLEMLGRTGTQSVRLFALYDAQQPGAPFSPDWKKNLAFGGVIGLVLGYGFAFMRRALDGRVRYTSDVETMTGRSVLGVVPKTDELEGQRQAGGLDTGIASEALRQLRTNLRFVDVDHRPKSIVVTSCNPGEGKSTISANLARLLAETGQPTVIMDADLRRPTLHQIFKADNAIGLTQVLAGDASAADVLQPTATTNLMFIPSGRTPPNPSELVGSQRMHKLIELLSKDYIVIIDAPPLLPVTDAGLLTKSSDGALFVIAVGKTFKEQLRLSVKLLNQIGGHLLGSVMNLAPKRGMGSVMYGYGYGGYQRSYKKYGYESVDKTPDPTEVSLDSPKRATDG